MQKGDALSFGADARHFVDETDGRRATAREGRVQIVDDEADVMNARTSFSDELSDWRVRRVGLEQLDECVAGGKSGDARSIGIVERHVGQLQDVAIERKQLVEPAHGDADMGDARAAARRLRQENVG